MTHQQIDYKILHKDLLSRTGIIKLKNGRSIETPINWIGLSVAESADFQFDVFKEAGVKNFLSNVYDLKYQDKKGIRQGLISRLSNEGLFHKVDSGGFQLMKQEIAGKIKFELTPEIAYNVQKNMLCDIGVILDHPIGTINDDSQIYKKIDKTIINFEKLLKIYDNKSDDFSILPVIHGHSEKMIDYSLTKLEDVLGEVPKALGIGSLVPMVKSIKNSGVTGGKKNFVNVLIYLRNKIPNTFIHAFGIGGTMAYLAFLCGVDSIDSNGWILKASRGVIQLPGTSDRFLRKKKHNRPFLIENRKLRGSNKIVNEVKLFMKCECPACREYQKDGKWTTSNWILKRNNFDQYNEDSRKKRAIHNLWLYQNELEKIKNNIKKNKTFEFIKKRLENSIYKNLIEEIINKTKQLEIFEYL